MKQQSSRLCKRHATNLARVRLLSGVAAVVHLQMIAAHERRATHFTDVLALARVTAHVQVKIAHRHEAAVTLAARELRLLSHAVGRFVLVQVLLRGKPLPTNAASKRVAVPVLRLVQLQAGAVRERFPALVALERLLASVVRATVALQRRVLRERCTAVFALVRLLARVQALVHLERFLGFEGIAASFAHERLDVLVCQHVTRFVTRLGEASAADVTSVSTFRGMDRSAVLSQVFQGPKRMPTLIARERPLVRV